MNCSHFNRPARLRSPGAASSSQSSLFEAVVGSENNESQVTTSFSQSIENILPTEHVQDSTAETIQTEQDDSNSNPEATSTSSLDQKSTSQSSLVSNKSTNSKETGTTKRKQTRRSKK